jgi:hypothetical protein
MDYPSLAEANPHLERFCPGTKRKYETSPFNFVSRIHPDELPQKMKDLMRNPEKIN